MKSLLEAAIAILIVYLFLEYFKNNQASSAGMSGGGSTTVAGSATASASGCCCGGGGASGGSKAPGVNAAPVGPIGYQPITNIGFGTINPTPVYTPIASVPASPAPVPRFQEQINS